MAPGNNLQKFVVRLVYSIVLVLVLTSCLGDGLLRGEVELEQIDKQPYTLLRNEDQNEPPVQNLLVITSADPFDSVSYQEILDRNYVLRQIIESHWDVDVDIILVDEYEKNLLKEYDALFLIEEYDKIPIPIITDIVNSDEETEIIFSGFKSASLLTHILKDLWSHGSEEAIDVIPPQALTVRYKDVEFAAAKLDVVSSFPSIPQNDILKINVLATYEDSSSQLHPLIVDIDDRFLILPFELPHYYEVYDYTLVFLDVLHYALGHHVSNRTALLRLEDLNPYTYKSTVKIRDVYELLKQKEIPFHLAIISRYINPEEKVDLYTHEARLYLRYLKLMVGEGLGTLIQHGYTHQINGISGIDYEYWDDSKDAPLSYDSEEYVTQTLLNAQSEMRFLNLPIPDVFETPHYALSELDNTVVNRYYPLRYEHIYNVGSLPITVNIDDRIYFPTNLGYVAKWSDVEVQEKARLLEKVSVFEDPVASFFWHPWRDLSELQYMINLMEQQGYKFVSVYDLLDKESDAGYYELESFRGTFDTKEFILQNRVIDFLTGIVFIGFSTGSILYVINTNRINQYFKKIESFEISMDEIRAMAREKKRELPNLGIMVPARNEGYVIGNTVRKLLGMDYPNEHYRIYIIVDERELDDDVEVLTKEEAQKLADEVRQETGINLVKIIEVPKWFSGEFGNLEFSNKKSTKGRALNFALEYLMKSEEWDHLEMFGILDADGRLDKHVLKEVAYHRIKNGSQLLQGSVFQVSNYDNISLVGVVAGLELAIHHLTVLPARMLQDKVQFLAGTNYFIDKGIVSAILGWDQDSLVEDAELALRIYSELNVKAGWIRSPELEQSPANFSVYNRQRERWARGHLILLDAIRKADISAKEKVTFYYKIFISQFRFLFDVALFWIAIGLIAVGAFAYLSPFLKGLSIFLAIMSILIMDTYGYIYRKIAYYIEPEMKFSKKVIQSLKLFSYFLALIVVQAVPRVRAIWNFLFRKDTGWYKTERTKESIQNFETTK